jgi:hypothetical protein
MAEFEVVDHTDPQPHQPFVRIPLPADQTNYDEAIAQIKTALSKGLMVIVPDCIPNIPITGWNDESFQKLFYDLNRVIVCQGTSVGYIPENVLMVNTLDAGRRHIDRVHPHVTLKMGEFYRNGYNGKVCQNNLDHIQYLDDRP